ncbi:MAG: Sec-independent protein translocase subunit TatA/TatB [Candidatus Binataceae bacterium]
MGIVEILILLVVLLIVVPPEHLPEIMRSLGKILRELRLASNTVMRELSGTLDEPPPYLSQRPSTPPKPEQLTPPPSDKT